MHYRRFAAGMALVLLLSTVLSPAAALAAADSNVSPVQDITAQIPTIPTPDRVQKEKARVIGETDAGGTEAARYIVQLQAAPVALYQGEIEGLSPTTPAFTGQSRLAVESASAQAYQSYLQAEQATALATIDFTLGRSVNSVFSYQVVFNGFTLELTPQEAATVAAMEGVKSVYRDKLNYLQTDAGPAWIGSPTVWDGRDVPSNVGTRGEGIVVGILDSGINMDNPSFADVGDDGYDHMNPRGKLYGVCDANSELFDPAFTCNDKLIGAYDFADTTDPSEDDGPEDNDGHGSHTASTTAGNVVNMSRNFPTIVYGATISGVAPHANIISYDVCYLDGCPGSATLAATEQAVIDKVDVINYSIGSPSPTDPWLDAATIAFLAATEAGVVVVTSTGNNGPGFATVGSPNNAPWMFAVGASTHDRKLLNSLVNMSGGDTNPPADLAGKSLTSGYGPAPVVYAGDYGDALCLEPFPAGTFDGEIVVCDRGQIARVGKGQNVLDGGAGGYVLANDAASGNSLNGDPHVLPGVHITYADAVILKEWLATGEEHAATISGTTANLADANGDIMASFSSRGANDPIDIIKPDITGPGVDILAAYKDPEDYEFLSGTSMSGPHVAGAAALMNALHPDWTPSQIKSALMTTALVDGVVKEDGVTPADPFDFGAGRVDLTKAAKAGFVLDITGDEYIGADPAVGGEPSALNLPSLGKGNCVGICSWTRTIQSTLDQDVDWTVAGTLEGGGSITIEPASFTLAAGDTQDLIITTNVVDADQRTWLFGQVVFTPSNDVTVPGRFPVAVYSDVISLSDIEIETRRDQGRYAIEDIVSIEITDFNASLYADAPTVTDDIEVAQDPTNDNPYDLGNGGVVWQTVELSADSKVFNVYTANSTSPDLDLYVGFDGDGDGEPDADEELGFSASGTADEQVRLSAPLEAGTYWILAQNWDASEAEVDTFSLGVTIVDSTDSTEAIVLTTPDSVDAESPFDISIDWNILDWVVGEPFIGVLEIADGDDFIISVGVDLLRQEDDVTLSTQEEVVEPGATLTYEISVEVEPSIKGDFVVYNFTATLPDGLTYVDGSAAIPPTTVSGNTIVWNNIPVSKLRDYVQSNSTSDPMCDTGFGGYVDLEGLGITTVPGVEGDGVALGNPLGTEFDFYGTAYEVVGITDDGFLTVLGEVGDDSSVNTDLPDPALPNGLMAPMWRDLALVYDAELNRGLSIASGGTDVYIFEYDGVEPSPVGSTSDRFDFEVVLWTEVDDTPGVPEIIFAYDNLNGDVSPATIGVENADGTSASKYAFNDANLEDGFQICYDWIVPSPSITATFQALVGDSFDGRTNVETKLDHTVVADGYGTDTASVFTIVQAPTAIDDEAPDFVPGEDQRIFLPVIKVE
jgi:subtilisin family serine protease